MQECLQSAHFAAIIDYIARGFEFYSQGKVSVPPIQTLGQPPIAPFTAALKDKTNAGCQMCIKSGYITGEDQIVVKMAPGGVLTNSAIGFMTNSGINMVFSQLTARLDAIVFDEGLLTEIRTAACGALAAKLFAPPAVSCIGILGSGPQARWQLRMLGSVIACRNVKLFALERLEEFKAEMELEGWRVTVCGDAEAVVRDADLLVTVTTTRTPIVKAAWLRGRKNMHISCIGADAPGKGELEPDVVKMADFLCCDARAQTFERGEFQHAHAKGLLSDADVIEIGEVLSKPSLHRQKSNDDRITIFDTSGVAVQDIMITKYVFDALSSKSRL
jgi:ornithine cyclodeaminase